MALCFQASILAHSRTNSDRPRRLSLLSTAQLLSLLNPAPWGLNRELEVDWTAKVSNRHLGITKTRMISLQSSYCAFMALCFDQITALNLDNQRISRLINLNKLVNLRWGSFNDNDISKVEGLDSCSQLEELSLNNNYISSITGRSHRQLASEVTSELYDLPQPLLRMCFFSLSISSGLSKLNCLRKLSLDGNQLSSLDASFLDQLQNLSFLSVENNCISSLHGIKRVRSLRELYIGNNQISTSQDIYYLKVKRKRASNKDSDSYSTV